MNEINEKIEEIEEIENIENIAEDEEMDEKGAHSFPCPSCGASLVYDIKEGELKCQFCGTIEDINEKIAHDVKEYDFYAKRSDEDNDWGLEVENLHCDSCGADMNIEPTTKSSSCPFCGSNYVVREKGKDMGIKPETLIPFKIDRNFCKESFEKWLSSQWLAPNNLKKEAKTDKLQGVYIPYWTYDADTYTDYIGKRGTYYYVNKTVTRNGKTTTVRERRTRWTRVSGNLSKYYDDTLVSASKKHNNPYLDRVDDFNYIELVHFDPKFLAGFLAEKYSVNLDEGWVNGKAQVDNMITRDIKNQIGGDTQVVSSKNTNYNKILYKHLLLPMWISNYTYNGKNYQYVINGQSGKVAGKAPLSPWKVTILSIIGLVVAFLAIKFLDN